IFSISLCVVNCLSVYYGIGKHITTLELNQNFWICQIVYKFSINLTKLSILLLYLRIFVGRTFKRFACGVMIYVVTYGFASIAATIFQCQPVRRAFDHTIPGHCLDVTAFWYSNASANVLGDLMIFALPWPLIYRLQLPPREKYILCLIFGLGIFVITTSILRMTTLKVSSKAMDATYGTMVSTLWTTVETNTAIVCACLPTLKAPLAKWFPRLFSRSTASASRQRQYNNFDGSRRAAPYIDEAIQLSVEVAPPGTIARRTEVDVQVMPKSSEPPRRKDDNFETGARLFKEDSLNGAQLVRRYNLRYSV
ncbi:MAG: hypothetical protein Q9214_006742, partial [Letrouitia sp. 1 TL-2023]